MLQKILGGFLDLSVRDGLSSELAITEDAAKFKDYVEPSVYPEFIQLAARHLDTYKMEDLNRIAASSVDWQRFETAMNSYFDDTIILFPYEGSIGSPRDSLPETKDELPSDSGPQEATQPDLAPAASPTQEVVTIAKPDRFFDIQAQMIERRFPGGRRNDAGDDDLRYLISCLRYVFGYNYWQLIARRRAWTTLGAAIICAAGIATVWMAASGPLLFVSQDGKEGLSPLVSEIVGGVSLLLGLGATCIAVYLGLQKRYETLTKRYRSALTVSCANLRGPAIERLERLVSAVDLVYKQVQNDEAGFRRAGRLSDWSAKCAKWCVCGVWISRRVEHIELFMQLEMWRIRRIHYGLQIIARWMSWLIAIAFSLAFSFFVWIGYSASLFASGRYWSVALVCCLAVAALVMVARASFTVATVDVNLIEKTLLSRSLPGHHNTLLHVHMAGMVQWLISEIQKWQEAQHGGS